MQGSPGPAGEHFRTLRPEIDIEPPHAQWLRIIRHKLLLNMSTYLLLPVFVTMKVLVRHRVTFTVLTPTAS